MAMPLKDALYFPASERGFLDPWIPGKAEQLRDAERPFTTLTFATSLDSSLALSPGQPTAISGPQSKAMTHYLRSCHDAILIGVGTAVADDPSLNCRLSGAAGYGGEGLDLQPRPVVIDPAARWEIEERSKIARLAAEGRGRAPFIITRKSPASDKETFLKRLGGKYIVIGERAHDEGYRSLEWAEILGALKAEGLGSVMIEGGGAVINSLLLPQNDHLIDSVIVTIAPTWLGQGGVVVSPSRRFAGNTEAIPAARLQGARWHPLGDDVVLCGHLRR